MNDLAKKPKTLEEIIKEKLGPDFDPDELDRDWRVSWFPAPGKTTPRNLDLGQRWPANPYLLIYLIFGDEDEARVYCYPEMTVERTSAEACASFLKDHNVTKKEDLPKHLLMPTLFRLSMTAPVYRASSMTSDRFAEKIVEEFEEAAGDDRAVEERILVVDWLRKQGAESIANAIENEEHLDDGGQEG